jgi:hypothetical protein
MIIETWVKTQEEMKVVTRIVQGIGKNYTLFETSASLTPEMMSKLHWRTVTISHESKLTKHMDWTMIVFCLPAKVQTKTFPFFQNLCRKDSLIQSNELTKAVMKMQAKQLDWMQFRYHPVMASVPPTFWLKW